MKSNYNQLGQYIEMVSRTNSDLKYGIEDVRGCSNTKQMMQTRANLIGRTYEKFIVLKPREFVFNRRTTRNGEKIGMAYNNSDREYIFTNDYVAFRVKREYLDKLLPDYLYLFFCRDEFDRYARYKSTGSATEFFNWEDMCAVPFEIPPMDFQQLVVNTYKVLNERIEIKRKINDNLINTTDTIFFKVFLENKPTATISFTDIVQLMGGGTPKTDEDSFWNGNILFFTPKDISRSPFCISTEKHLTNEGLNNCSSRLYPPYTTFVTCRGTVGNLALAGVPMAMNQSCYALKGKNDFPALFVFSFTRYVIATMKKKASGAVFSALVTRDFEMEKVFEPNFGDAILFERRVEPLFAQILANTNEIQQLLDLQNALLTQLSSR